MKNKFSLPVTTCKTITHKIDINITTSSTQAKKKINLIFCKKFSNLPNQGRSLRDENHRLLSF